MGRTHLGLLLVLLGLTAHPDRCWAQGFIIPELGARKNGMGTAIGRPDDLSAIYHNPAALALLPGTQIGVSFGLVHLTTDIRLAPWAGSEKYLTDPVDSEGYFPRQSPSVIAPMPFIGASTNLFSSKVVGAIGIYVPNAAGASFGDDAPSRYHITDAYVVSAFFTGAVAYRPWPCLALGFGVSAVYVRINRRFRLFPVINGSDFSGVIGSNTELEIEGQDLQPAFHLGVQVWPHRTLSFGFMALSRYDVSLEGPLTLKLGEDASPMFNKPEFTDNEHRTEISAPWIIGFGANWDVTPWLEVGAEFRLYLNDIVDEQRTTITKGEILPDLLPDGFITPKNLHDSWHTGAGINVRPMARLELMTGMHYEISASPDNTVEVSAPSFDLAAAHIGARYRITDRLGVSLHYAHYWYFERSTSESLTSPPTNFIGSGASNVVAVTLEAQVAPGIGVN
jgi:long-chain fatty acid transport protein